MILAAIKISVWLFLLKSTSELADTQVDANGALYCWHQAQSNFAAQGVELKLTRFRVVRDFTPRSRWGLGGVEGRLYSMVDWANARRMTRRGRVIHFITSRTLEGYTAGVSYQQCGVAMKNTFVFRGDDGQVFKRGGALSYSTGQFFNTAGKPRLDYSAYALIHELGHDVGAGHIDSETVMNSGALEIFNRTGQLDWDQTSISEIYQCLSRR